jgi:predicted TIM-barrel fold metal-dependent hydrolase
MEPLDLWWNALGQKFGDRTPRVLNEYQGEKGTFFYSGYQGGPVNKIRENTTETEAAAVEAADRGFEACGYDPAVRVKFQEEAGITAEAMNSTRLLAVMRNPDIEVKHASAEVFNDWEAEFCSYSPKRLLGISVIPMHDIGWAMKELERTTKKGLVGPMINCVAPEGSPPFRDPIYDRFWSLAEEAGAPITLHLLTGRALDPLPLAALQTPEEREEDPGMWVELFNEIQGGLTNDFIFGGILDRHPKLKIVCSEFEMSWIPGLMARLDQAQAVASDLFITSPKEKASDYFRTRIYHGFIDDPMAQYSIPVVGADKVLWGSDFPHIRSIGLEAQGAVAKLLETLPAEEQKLVLGENAAKVFNLD